ncbi:hypothetical protein AOCH_000093 [Aspergillus ochraceoroseus]|uniref:Sphingomyelin phosphodiesterase n=2 Tax=Aspergillus ochraceoroseus TaxID=138278 RepID=A0A0F8V1C7_9EURO|nr:hypothetical protein AOCH_000093 [Aspergillus ochraceoroseus]
MGIKPRDQQQYKLCPAASKEITQALIIKMKFGRGVARSALSLLFTVAVLGPGVNGSRNWASEILADIEDAAECSACETLLAVLKELAHLGNDAFVDVITDVCTASGAEDEDVCTGIIAREGPILAHDLRLMDIGSSTSQWFCGSIFGLCQPPAVTEYSVPFPSAKPNTTRPTPSGETPIQIVHFSDIHVDLSYETGASWNCSKNICCRPYTSADAPGNTSYPAGAYGDHHCDAPLSLEQSMYAAIREIAPHAALSLFTGDVVESAEWVVTNAEVVSDLDSAYGNMTSSSLPPVYAAVGNHDVNPINSFPPAAVDTTISSQYVYDTLSSLWDSVIGSTAASVAESRQAAYSVVYGDKLRIISLNTMLYYKENFWMYEEPMETDPSGQLAWLVDELQAAENASQRAYIIGHMPMGTGDAFHDASNYFNQIVDRYEATIAALFFGHTHKDEFEIAYSDYTDQTSDTAIAMSYIAPAMTPKSGNPSFRVYTVDPVTFGVLDMTAYIANMSASTYQSAGPVWEKYYSVKEAYGPLVTPALTDSTAELTPAFWHNLTEVFADNSTAFDEYYARKSRGWDVASCTGTCVTDEICMLRAAEAQYNCITVTPGLQFSKRDAVSGGHAHDGECEGSGVKKIFQKLMRAGN